jgi:hypothetical protein
MHTYHYIRHGIVNREEEENAGHKMGNIQTQIADEDAWSRSHVIGDRLAAKPLMDGGNTI